MPTDPQKSDVHESTADADTSPTADPDAQATRRAAPGRDQKAWPDAPPPLVPDPPADVRIVDDQTDDGGPLVVESNDPDLNPPRAPIDPFPTLAKPEIDPLVK